MNMPENVDLFDLVTQYPGLLSPFPQVLCFLSLKPGQQKVDQNIGWRECCLVPGTLMNNKINSII